MWGPTKNIGPDQFSRFEVYWIQTTKQTDRQAKYIIQTMFDVLNLRGSGALLSLFCFLPCLRQLACSSVRIKNETLNQLDELPCNLYTGRKRGIKMGASLRYKVICSIESDSNLSSRYILRAVFLHVQKVKLWFNVNTMCAES